MLSRRHGMVLGSSTIASMLMPAGVMAETAQQRAALRTHFERFTGDFDALLKRRVIRVLVPYSPTLFFQDKGTIYGVSAEAVHLLEAWINKTYKLGRRPLTMIMIPTTRDRLFPDLLAGIGDMAIGDITITEERRKQVAFTTPTIRNVKEIILTDSEAPDLPDIESLSGKTVAVRRSTSFHESLVALNQRLAANGKPPVDLLIVPDTLESEDMMEMVTAGLLPAMVADDWIAGLWVGLLKGLKLQPKAELRGDGDIAWAVRPDNPKLLEVLNRAILDVGGSPAQLANKTKIFLAKLKRLHSATRGEDLERFRATLSMFRKYAGQYRFDALLLVAQSYQESRLDQNARSHVGAIGLMQLMPATGGSLGVGDIRRAEANVHAGSKYMAQLMDKYFRDAKFDDQNRNLFAFAAYNAGPNRIRKMQTVAEQQNLDPNVWFDNVERVVAANVGQEPVRYVRNIYKYYVAYKLIADSEAAKEAATRSIPKGQ